MDYIQSEKVVSDTERLEEISSHPNQGEVRQDSCTLDNIKVTKIVNKGDVDDFNGPESVAVKKIPRDLAHDWVVFLSATLVMLAIMSFTSSFGAVFPYILEEFQESRASTAAIHSILIGVGRCTGFVSGIIIQRNGPRNSGIIGAILYSAGLIVSAFATSTVYMQVSYGIFSGLGFGFLFISAVQALGQCFWGQARLIAVAVGQTAFSVGSMVYPYLVDWLVISYGLKGTLLILGGIMLNAIPLAFTWDNSKQIDKDSNHSEQSAKPCGVFSTIISTIKYSPFSFVLFGIGLSLTAVTIFEILSLDILESAGLSHDQSIVAYVAMKAAVIPACLVPGFINKLPGCSSGMAPVIGALVGGTGLILLNYISGFTGCIALFIVIGIARGIISSCQTVVPLKMLGTSKHATGVGLILCLSGVSTTAIGPLNGFLRDISGSYFTSLSGGAGAMFLSLILCLIAMMLHRKIKNHRKDDKTETPVAVFTVTRL